MTDVTPLVHILPQGDLSEHIPKLKCWCCPEEDEGVVIHRALDRRDLYETIQ